MQGKGHSTAETWQSSAVGRVRALSRLKSEYFLPLQIRSLLLHAEIPWEYPKQAQTPAQARCLYAEHSVPPHALHRQGCFEKHILSQFWSALPRHPQSSSIPLGSRYHPCVWQLGNQRWFLQPGFASTFRNISQLLASGYNSGHVSPARVKHCCEASPEPFQTPRSNSTGNQLSG